MPSQNILEMRRADPQVSWGKVIHSQQPHPEHTGKFQADGRWASLFRATPFIDSTLPLCQTAGPRYARCCIQTSTPPLGLRTQPVKSPLLPTQNDVLFFLQDLAQGQQFPWSLPYCWNQNVLCFPLWFSNVLFLFLLEFVSHPVFRMVFLFPYQFPQANSVSQVCLSSLNSYYEIRYIEFSLKLFW